MWTHQCFADITTCFNGFEETRTIEKFYLIQVQYLRERAHRVKQQNAGEVPRLVCHP